MKINVNVILNMVAPHTAGSTLTFDAFDRLFSMLSRDEQSCVTDLLAARGIHLVDADDDRTGACAAEFTVDGAVFGGNDPLAFAGAVKKSGGRMNELLARDAQEGSREALEQLFRDNERLVWDVVLRYTGMCGTCLTEKDLFQAGAVGMMKAVEMFRYELGYKFSTYSLWWIRQAVIREIENNGFTIRIPVHKQEQVRRVMRVYRDLTHRGVLAEQGIRAVAEALEEMGFPMAEDQVIECIQLHDYVMGCTSLDKPVNEEGDTSLGEIVPDERENPEIMLDRIAMRSDLMDALQTLSPRERLILTERFGLDGQGERTLEVIGAEMGVTRERIRQIEQKALRKLRKPSCVRKLKDWLEAA